MNQVLGYTEIILWYFWTLKCAPWPATGAVLVSEPCGSEWSGFWPVRAGRPVTKITSPGMVNQGTGTDADEIPGPEGGHK